MYARDPKFDLVKTIKQTETDKFKANAAKLKMQQEQYACDTAQKNLNEAMALKEQQRLQHDYLMQMKQMQEQEFQARLAAINANKRDSRVQIYKNDLESQMRNQEQVTVSRAMSNYYDQVKNYNQEGLFLEGAVRLQEIKNTMGNVKAAKVEQLRSQYENAMREKRNEQIRLETLAKQKQYESLQFNQQRAAYNEIAKQTSVRKEEVRYQYKDIMSSGIKK